MTPEQKAFALALRSAMANSAMYLPEEGYLAAVESYYVAATTAPVQPPSAP